MRCDNGAVVISLPKAFTSPDLDFTSPRVVFTSPGLVFTSRRVVKPSRGVVHASREFVTVNQYFVKTSRQDVRGTFRLLYNMARAHIFIRTLCSEKAFTRSPVVHFTLISISFACEGLRREAFTPPFPAVNTSFSNPSHLKQLKINKLRTFCEGVNTFFGLILRI